MAEENQASKREPASVPGRLGIGLNVLLQVLLSLLIIGSLNYLAYRHYWRWDLSPTQDHTLSTVTTNYLRKNSREVAITALFVRGSPISENLKALLEEYHRHGKKLVKVEFVDPVRDAARTEALKIEAGITLRQNGLLIQANRRKRFVSEDEILMRIPQPGSPQPALVFRGEDAVTSAIIALNEGETRTFHFITGKGSVNAESGNDVIAALADIGKQQNFEVKPLNLAEAEKIPEGTSGLVVAGLRYDFTEREMRMIAEYWSGKKAGLTFLLDPSSETGRLDQFLETMGVRPRRDRVLVATSTSSGVKKQFEVQAEFSKETVITGSLSDAGTTLAGQTQSLELRPDDGKLQEQGVVVIPLVKAADRFWGERNYLDELPVADGKDTLPPVHIAAAIERGASADQAVRSESSRMVVIGNALLLDRRTSLAVDRDFIAACLNWMANREKLIGITPKQKAAYRIQLTPRQHQLVFWITAIFMPAVVLGLGFIIWAVRRSA
jgi:hypothetical protein